MYVLPPVSVVRYLRLRHMNEDTSHRESDTISFLNNGFNCTEGFTLLNGRSSF